jgi:hypothetical protein
VLHQPVNGDPQVVCWIGVGKCAGALHELLHVLSLDCVVSV